VGVARGFTGLPFAWQEFFQAAVKATVIAAALADEPMAGNTSQSSQVARFRRVPG